MITYGHEKYIRQAIESILTQECNFNYELIVANDCSPDLTDEIINEIIRNNPKGNLIKYVNRSQNIGMQLNYIDAYQNCKGKYIATCEGDDYWTDPLKLQKQVDFLEGNPEYAISFHKVDVLQDGIIKEDTITAKVPETTTIKDLARGNYIHTCSVVYRNNLFAELPEYFKESPVGDYFLHLLNARFGMIKCFEETMGVYRVYGTSVWSSKTQNERELLWVPFLENIKSNFDHEIQEILIAQIAFYTKPTEQQKAFRQKRKIMSEMIQKIKGVFANK